MRTVTGSSIGLSFEPAHQLLRLGLSRLTSAAPDQGEEEDESDEDGAGETSPLLPIFSAAHLGEFTPETFRCDY